MATNERRLAAIMFTDMVGYSALAQADEAVALQVLGEHNRLLRPIFTKFRGREVKTVGDAFLVEFESALEAAHCAIEIQRLLHDHNLSTPVEGKILVRIGIHIGDVVQSDGDLFGDAVNIASRIEPLADPGGVCVTQQVYDQVQNKLGAPLVRLPPRALKNISSPVTVYRIRQPWEVRGPEPAVSDPARGHHLAVLPLANISPDPGDGYFADGLTEELISVLSQVHDLSVIARTSVIPYKTAPKSIADVGAELGVDTVLEGSVRKSGNRIRITLQLIEVATQRHLWASTYNREIGDVFSVQTDIAERTAEALRLELAKPDSAEFERRPTANPAAYNAYLRGLVAAQAIAHQGVEDAARCFERATQLDPTFAEAYAAWGNLYVTAAGDFLPMQEVMPKARALASRALELDPDSSEAHGTLANIAAQFDHDWAFAEKEFERAIELNPSNVAAWSFFGLLLMGLGRFEDAKDVYRRAIRLDPGGGHQRSLAWSELESGNYATALESAEAERDAHSEAVEVHNYLGWFYLAAGRRDDALREALTPLVNASDTERFDHALLNALVGRPDEAREVAAEVERGEAKSYTSATHLAMLFAALGERTKALDLLEKDVREGDQVFWIFNRGTFFDSIRDDPRFVALLQQFGLPLTAPHRERPTAE